MLADHKKEPRTRPQQTPFEHEEASYVDAVLSATKSRALRAYCSFGDKNLADALRILCGMGIVSIKIDLGDNIQATRIRQGNKALNAL